VLLALIAGCNNADKPAVTATSGSDGVQDGSSLPPTVSIGMDQTPAVVTPAEPEPGSAEWLLQEIQRIRMLPVPSVGGEDSEAPAASSKEAQESLNRMRTVRRERNQEIVKLATQALAQTAKDPQKEPLFLAAVGNMLDAQLQLALQGDQDSLAALYAAADAFHQKKPNSEAAAAAQLTLVNLAHAHSMRYGKSEPRWLTEFSHQAQLYATRYPSEEERALPLLQAAGKTCELNGLSDEAKSCYGVIQTKFPESPQARQSEGVLRRLGLVGKPLQFGGPTLDGNFLSLEDYSGKAVVVVFWATHVTAFRDQVASLQEVTKKYAKYAQVVSVNLDSEEAEIDAFLEETKLSWPVIFHVEPEKRGWNAPLAAYYGISVLPSIWIVDPQGKVADTQITAENLEAKLREVLLKHLNKAAKTDGSN